MYFLRVTFFQSGTYDVIKFRTRKFQLLKSGNFEKFINCSTNSLIGIVPYRDIGIQPIGNVSTITYNITFSKKMGRFRKKTKLTTTAYRNSIMSVCKIIIIEMA